MNITSQCRNNISHQSETYQKIFALTNNNQLGNDRHFLTREFQQLSTLYDVRYSALWCIIKTKPAPVFSQTLLENIRAVQDAVAELNYAKPLLSPKYIIWLSDSEHIFSLGMDLNILIELIVKKDKKSLDAYLQKCIDVMYINLMKLDIFPLITLSLIRGKAYGGGFEAALSSDIIFAEEQSKCCFPEVNYNFLPSLGTLDNIMEKINKVIFKDLIFNGKHFDLFLLKNIGLIDEILAKDRGYLAIYDFIKRTHAKHRLYAALYKTKFNHNPLTYKKLENFKAQWLDVALHLKHADVCRLERLAKAQLKLGTRHSSSIRTLL